MAIHTMALWPSLRRHVDASITNFPLTDFKGKHSVEHEISLDYLKTHSTNLSLSSFCFYLSSNFHHQWWNFQWP